MKRPQEEKNLLDSVEGRKTLEGGTPMKSSRCCGQVCVMAKDRLEPCPERPGIGRARDLESSYRVLDGRVIIEIELDELRQIFNTFDPSPFHKRDIDDDAEEYIVGAARDIAMKRPLSLVVYLPPEKAARERSDLLEEAIHNYFDYRAMLSVYDKLRVMPVTILPAPHTG